MTATATMTIESSTDYAAIEGLLREPRALRRMGADREFQVGPRPGLQYVLVREKGYPVAVFLILAGIEVHFCFSPRVWGKTLEIAREFLEWAWENLDTPLLVGPIPTHNRLARKLALSAGFSEYPCKDKENLIYTMIERPA